MGRRLRRIAIIAIALILVAIGAAWWALSRPINVRGDGAVKVPRGSTVSGAVTAVHTTCPLPHPTLVSWSARIMARLTGRSVQSGWYRFTQGDTQLDVLRSLFSGHRRPTIRVTIPEGLTYREIAGIMARTLRADSASFVRWCESDSVIAHYGAEAASMEGYLMPDTYAFFWREDADVIGTRLAGRFADVWRDKCEGLLAASGRTKHEILTLASIVQTEAANVDEMPRIAGVYANRLLRGMRLEADPTVQYALGAKRRVLYRDLNEASPYNTYVHQGLPPGPIANVGTDAIMAAMKPEQHDYVFFVARGDGSGLHNFARTGTEHARNVRLYRARR